MANINYGGNRTTFERVTGDTNIINGGKLPRGLTKLPKNTTIKVVRGNLYQDADAGEWYTDGTYEV